MPIAFLRALAFGLAATSAVAARAEEPESPWFRRHHVVFGMGTGQTFEKDIFNVGGSADATAAHPEPAYDFAYAYNLNARWAVGLHLHGYSQVFHEYVTAVGGPARVKFDLDAYNQALRVQRFFTRGRLQPYAYGQAGLANGQVDAEGDVLKFAGASFGGGAGALLAITRYFGISVDAVISLGAAKWEDKPFPSSASRDFNPSYWAVTAGAALMIP